MLANLPLPRSQGAPGSARSAGATRTSHPFGALIVVIDDELQIRGVLRPCLEAAGFAIVGALTAHHGLDLVACRHPDLVILDLSLPDQDGAHVCRVLRTWSPVPIIVLSARASDEDKVTALEAGADDYVTKPFSRAELVARIRVALRHAAQSSGAACRSQRTCACFQTAGLVIDFEARRVSVEGRAVHLTSTEFAVLTYLAENASRVITHRTLLRSVWGLACEGEHHYLHVFIGRLRRKLEPNPTRPCYLLTEPGVGYRLHCSEGQLTSNAAPNCQLADEGAHLGV